MSTESESSCKPSPNKFYDIEFSKTSLNPIFNELLIETNETGKIKHLKLFDNETMTDSENEYKLIDKDMETIVAYHSKTITINDKEIKLKTLNTNLNDFFKHIELPKNSFLYNIETESESKFKFIWKTLK